jgi:hypothetical protein
VTELADLRTVSARHGQTRGPDVCGVHLVEHRKYLRVVERRLGRDVDTADRDRHTGDNEND